MRATSILCVLALGCGAAKETTDEGTIAHFADPPICTFEGAWTLTGLRTQNGGVPYATVHEVPARAALERLGALSPHFQLVLSHEGWTLRGMLDPAEDDALSVRELFWLHDGVAILPGSRPRVVDVREGELLLERSRDGFTEENGYHFHGPIARWAPCDALVPGRHASARYESVAPADAVERVLPASARAELSIEPGGAPFVEIVPREHEISVRVAETRGEHSRVVIDDWSGTLLVGWLASSLLSDEEAGMGGLGMIGGLVGGGSIEICTSGEQLALHVSGEEVGSVAPGTRYVVLAHHADGSLSISPHRLHLGRAGDAAWIVRPSAAPVCVSETVEPPSFRGEPDAVLTVRATVTRARGAISNGASCEATVEHFGGDDATCRAEIRCGARPLFGLQQTNGFFPCQFTAGSSPSVVGEDPETTSVSRDAAMRIDTGARRLTVDDDASGPAGEIHLEARIDSVAAR